jgi:hypothetical protein
MMNVPKRSEKIEDQDVQILAKGIKDIDDPDLRAEIQAIEAASIADFLAFEASLDDEEE